VQLIQRVAQRRNDAGPGDGDAPHRSCAGAQSLPAADSAAPT
jgi:hypothetical protein